MTEEKQLITIQAEALENRTEDQLEELLKDFEGTLDVLPKTKENYLAGIRYYLEWLKATDRQGNNREDVIAYKKHLNEDGLKQSSISTYVSSVRIFYRYLHGKNAGIQDITIGIKGGKTHFGLKKEAFTIDQVKKILGNMNRETLEEKRNFALVNLLFRSATRLTEIKNANVSDISFSTNGITLAIQGKGRIEKDQFIVLTPATYEPIQDYLNARGKTSEDAPLFASHSNRNLGGRMTTQMIGKIARDSFRAVGINSTKLTPHSTRHTAISILLDQNGGNLVEAKDLSRHANYDILAHYVHNMKRFTDPPEKKIDAILDGF